jgi:peptidoglycan hydrolase-like protein with peptidoglycan-binding domain
VMKTFFLVAAVSLVIFPIISRAAAHHSVSKRAQSRSRPRRRHSRRYSRVRTYQLHPTVERYKQIQQALADKSCYHGDIDGIWGPESISALQRFQTEQGIENEGKINALALIGLGLGPKHAGAIPPPPMFADSVQPLDNSASAAEGKQESTSLRPEDTVTANPPSTN